MAVLPTRTLEIEFDTGVWTNIAADVTSIATRRGRNRESGAFETGRLTFVVRNDTRKYDPDHTAGPYYGKLRPNRRVRFKATYSAVEFPVFQGYIDRITQNYGGPNDSTATFDVSDMFKILARVELPASVYTAEVAADTPVSLWPFGEPAAAPTAFDAVGTRNLSYLDGPTTGIAGLVVRDPATAVSFLKASLNRVGYNANLITAYPFSLEVWFKIPSASGSETLYMEDYGPVDKQMTLDIDSGTGFLRFYIGDASGTYAFVRNASNVADNAIHHAVVTATASNNVKMYVDGIDVTTGVTATANAFPAGTGRAAWGNWADGLSGRGLAGTLQFGAIYNTALSAARVAAHNTAGRTPWNGDTSGTRMLRIANLAGLAVGDTDLNAGSTTLQSTSLGGTALAYAQKIEETEAGRLFVSGAGKLTFLSRYNGDTGNYLTSQATLVDADSGAGRGYRATSADVDEATIVTRATVSREGSTAVTYKDAAAVTEFGLVDEVHDGLLHDSDAYSRYYAEWIVSTHKTPQTRTGIVEVVLPTDPANMYPDILGLELAERVTYKRKPQNSGSVITQTMRVEAIEHATGRHYWNTRLQLSPFNLGEGGYGTGIWDTSLWDQATWGL